MFKLTTLNHFLLVAWPCMQHFYFNLPYNRISYYILYPEQQSFTDYYALFS